MKQLGYYAKDNKNNLFQFEWANDDFLIIKDDKKVKANAEDYLILEIGYYTAEK